MSSFDDHIIQAKKNLEFLGNVNQSFSEKFDWQVTIAFYSALHLINAHVRKELGIYHSTHKDLANVISPMCRISNSAQLDQDSFTSYESLFILSRRARYLYNKKNPGNPEFTYSKHLAKSIRHLEKVIHFIHSKQGIEFEKYKIKCNRLKKGELTYFDVY